MPRIKKATAVKIQVIDSNAPEPPAVFNIERWDYPDGSTEVWLSSAHKRFSLQGAYMLCEMLRVLIEETNPDMPKTLRVHANRKGNKRVYIVSKG